MHGYTTFKQIEALLHEAQTRKITINKYKQISHKGRRERMTNPKKCKHICKMLAIKHETLEQTVPNSSRNTRKYTIEKETKLKLLSN